MDQHHPRRLRSLHLFAGAGGSLLCDVLLGHRPVCAVEFDPYCQHGLVQRQRDGVLPWFPIWGDVRDFDGRPWRGVVDVVSAGFPCQPWSVAGKRAGAADERNLWPDTIRVVREVRPHYVFLENVPALLPQPYFGHILGSMVDAGYDCRWCVLGADDVGAPHHRKRLWILASDPQWRELRQQSRRGRGPRGAYTALAGDDGSPADVADAQCAGQAVGHAESQGLALWASERGDDGEECPTPERAGGGESLAGLGRVAHGMAPGLVWAWPPEPAGVPRVATGIPDRVARLKALGNGWVPLCAAVAWHLLLAHLKER